MHLPDKVVELLLQGRVRKRFVTQKVNRADPVLGQPDLGLVQAGKIPDLFSSLAPIYLKRRGACF